MDLRLGGALRLTNRVAAAAVTPPSTLLDGLVSYWTLDEVSGTRVDSVGANDLSDNNTVGVAYPGPSGTGANLIAANSESLSKTGIDLSNTSFSASIWIKPTTVAFPQMIATMMTEVYPPSFMVYEQDNGGVTIVAGPSNADKSDVTSAAGSVSVGHWTHIYFQWDASSKKPGIAINGGTLSEGTATTDAITSGAHPLRFGARSDGNYLNAALARGGLWSRVLTSGERTSLFNSGAGKAYADLTAAEKVGLVSYWNLDETSDGSGAVTRVDSHGDNDLTDNGTTASATNTATKNGNAASFVAANSESLSVADPFTIDSITVSMWVKPTTDGEYGMIVTKDDTTNREFTLQRDTDGLAHLYVFGASASAQNVTGSKLEKDLWSLVILWFDSSDGKGYLQVNGGTVASTAAITTPIRNTDVALKFGIRTDGYGWTGLIDEPAIWSRVLTEDERAALYNEGAGRFYPFTGSPV